MPDAPALVWEGRGWIGLPAIGIRLQASEIAKLIGRMGLDGHLNADGTGVHVRVPPIRSGMQTQRGSAGGRRGARGGEKRALSNARSENRLAGRPRESRADPQDALAVGPLFPPSRHSPCVRHHGRRRDCIWL